MIIPLLGIGLAAYGGHRLWKGRKGGMSSDRQKIYAQAMANLADPKKLRTLADAFEKEGLANEAMMLRKRASLRELPEDVKKARRQAFRTAMQQKDPGKVETMAKTFDDAGAWGAAAALRKYAETLKAKAA